MHDPTTSRDKLSSKNLNSVRNLVYSRTKFWGILFFRLVQLKKIIFVVLQVLLKFFLSREVVGSCMSYLDLEMMGMIASAKPRRNVRKSS